MTGTRYDQVDLSKLQAPAVIEELSATGIVDQLKADLVAKSDGSYTVSDLESDPAVKLIEAFAFRELTLRQDMNDKIKSVLLAFADGSDLEHLSSFYSVARRMIDPGDPEANPPVPPTYESDEALRRRTQLAPEALTVAGSEGAYVFNALSAGETPSDVEVVATEPGKVMITYTFETDGTAAKVKDASAEQGPGDAEVIVSILSTEGDGTPSVATLDAVTTHLSGKHVRPLTDKLTVQAPTITNYTVEAVLHLKDGPDESLVLSQAQALLDQYIEAQHRLGSTIARSGIDAALHVEGVRRVVITQPPADIVCAQDEAPYATGTTLTTTEDP